MSNNILVLDDERAALNRTLRIISSIEPNCNVRGFLDTEDAFADISKGFIPEIAFLDIEMCGMNGIEVAKYLKEISPKTKIIFVTAYTQYAIDAFSVHARGYILKPVSEYTLRKELEYLASTPNKIIPEKSQNFYVRCFGNFEVFVSGIPVKFNRSKSKELLAYLVHKQGSYCTTRELAAILFEDKSYTLSIQSQIQTTISSMIKSLSLVYPDVSEVILRKRNGIAVNASNIECDYYDFLMQNVKAINSYMGEYMSQYEWAEFTLGYLDKHIERK